MKNAALVAVAVIALWGCRKAEPKPWVPRGMLPAVESFLRDTDHGFGSAVSTGPSPPWAKGPRQVVSFASGQTLLFYIEGNQVVSVYEEGMDGRVKVWPSPQ